MKSYRYFLFLFYFLFVAVKIIFSQQITYQPPVYKTGEADFISFAKEHVVYPDTLLETKVAANIFINKSGKVVFINAIGPDPLFNKAVRDGLKNMPDWHPALKNNEAIDTFFTQIIFFSLGGAKYSHISNIIEIVCELPLHDFVQKQNWKNNLKKISGSNYDSLQHCYFVPEIKDSMVMVKVMDSTKKVSAVFQYNILSTGTIDIASGIATYYYDVNQKRKEYPFQHFKIHGLYKSWYPNGQLEDIKLFHNDMLHGERLTYHNNGQTKNRSQWKFGELDTLFEAYTETGEKIDLSKFNKFDYLLNNCEVTIVTKQPEFPGGEKALKTFLFENIKFPHEGECYSAQGTVYVQFIIESDGSIKEFKILKGVLPCFDEEALRVIKLMPKWIPGFMNDKPVRVYMNLPIKFSISG